MLPLIGLIVAVYAVARLLQVPLEASAFTGRVFALAIVSLVAGITIILLTFSLMMSGVSSPLTSPR